MNLTYRLERNGYVIMNNGVDWIVQNGYIPYQKGTIKESAQSHIDAIIQSHNDAIANEQAAQQDLATIAQLQQQILSQQEQIDALVLAQLMQGGSL